MRFRRDFLQEFVPDRGLLTTAELFHEHTKVRPYEVDWGEGFTGQVPQDVYRQLSTPFKLYQGSRRIETTFMFSP